MKRVRYRNNFIAEDVLTTDDGTKGLSVRMYEILSQLIEQERDVTPLTLARCLKCDPFQIKADLLHLKKKKMVEMTESSVIMVLEKGMLVQSLLNVYEIVAEFAELNKGETNKLVSILSNIENYL